MRKRIVIDGTPDEVKVSCPVWSGGKSGVSRMWLTPHTATKGLPITIRHHLRRLRPQQPDGGSPVPKPGQPHSPLRFRDPGEGQQLPIPANDGTTLDVCGRAEIHAQGQFCGDENGHTSNENQAKAVFQVGHSVRRTAKNARSGQPPGTLRQQK